MKKIILSSVIILATLIGYAGDEDYMKTMEKNLKELKKAKKTSDYQALAITFENIAANEGDKWIPYYYAAYCNLQTVFSEGSEVNIDMVLDKADKYLAKARELSPENDEVEVLQGWIYQGRIMADPMGRGQQYSQKAAESFGKAKNINPDNPRIYFLTGQNVLHTPEAFGGGKDAACPYFVKAAEKYVSFKPETPISPNWGMEYNQKLANDCK